MYSNKTDAQFTELANCNITAVSVGKLHNKDKNQDMETKIYTTLHMCKAFHSQIKWQYGYRLKMYKNCIWKKFS